MVCSNYKERINLMKKFTIYFFASLLLLPPASHAFSVKHDLFVTVGAFDASLTEFTYTLTPKDYQITSTVSTNGFFDTIYPFKANYKTTGKLLKDKMITTDYNYNSQSRFKFYSKKVFFSPHGEPLYQIAAKNSKEKKRTFDPSPTPADTFDLLTIFARMAWQYNQVGFCDSQLAVYDGKRRFDVIFKDEGSDTLPKNEHSFYSGKAAKCSFHIVKLLSDDDDSLWEFTANKPVYFWIARDPKTNYPFIAHVLVNDTPLGKLNAYTTKITIEE